MKDIIDISKAVLDSIQYYDGYDTELYKEVSSLLSTIPSRRKGHWIKDLQTATEDYYICSECGRKIKLLYPHITVNDLLNNYPYCHCGAEMVKESSDADSN